MLHVPFPVLSWTCQVSIEASVDLGSICCLICVEYVWDFERIPFLNLRLANDITLQQNDVVIPCLQFSAAFSHTLIMWYGSWLLMNCNSWRETNVNCHGFIDHFTSVQFSLVATRRHEQGLRVTWLIKWCHSVYVLRVLPWKCFAIT